MTTPFKPKPDWSSIDWSKHDAQIAAETGFCRRTVLHKRRELGVEPSRHGRPVEYDTSKVNASMSAIEIMQTLGCSKSTAYTIRASIGSPAEVTGHLLVAVKTSDSPETWQAERDGIVYTAVLLGPNEFEVTTTDKLGVAVESHRRMRDAMRRAVQRAQRKTGTLNIGRCACGNQGVVFRFNDSICARCDAIEVGQYSGRAKATRKTTRFLEEFGEAPNAFVMHYSKV